MSSSRAFTRAETVAVADTVAWVHGKHNLRFGGDFRRVYDDMIGNTNSTGTFVFTGLFTEAPGSGTAGNSGFNGFASSGSSLADMLLGLPQETTLQAAYQEAHLRENEMDGYAQDDWRAMKNTTFSSACAMTTTRPIRRRTTASRPSMPAAISPRWRSSRPTESARSAESIRAT